MNYHNLSTIKGSHVDYLPTHIPAVDNMFNGKGLPKTKISNWSGEAGVGKSRTTIHICKVINSYGHTVLYITGELPKEQFKEEKLKGFVSPRNNFYLMDKKGMTLENIIDAIITLKPALCVLDSIQTLREFQNGRKAEEVVDGDEVQMGLRRAAEIGGTHLALLSQQTADGKVKGGSELPHMVDTNIFLNKYDKDIPALFVIKVGKNRCGGSGMESVWVHTNEGVHPDEFQIDVNMSSKGDAHEEITTKSKEIPIDFYKVDEFPQNGVSERNDKKKKPRGFWGLMFDKI